MSTTTIVAELLVAGLFGIAWLLLLVLSYLGIPAIRSSELARVKEWMPLLTIATVAASYALGVLIDRIADSILDAPDKRRMEDVVGPDFPLGRTRVLAAYKSGELASYLGYVRSRMRIARALYFNSMFLGPCAAFFAARTLSVTFGEIVSIVALGLCLLGAARFAWVRISTTFYRRLRDVREILLTDTASATVLRRVPERVIIGTEAKPLGTSREEVHRHGTKHYSAHLFCYHKDGVFLQRRARRSTRNAGTWTSTVSGHITEADALNGTDLVLNVNTALRTVTHESREELRVELPVADSVYIGAVDTVSRGGGETCFCRTYVFALNVEGLSTARTDEVEEVQIFAVSEIVAALKRHRGLPSRGVTHPFADNFPAVFDVFVSWHESGA